MDADQPNAENTIMDTRMTVKKARPIVTSVLAKHNLSITEAGSVSLIADGLCIASDPEFFVIAEIKDHNEDHRQRTERAALLEQLISEYRQEMRTVQIRSTDGHFSGQTHYWMHRNHGVDFAKTLTEMESLLETEQFITDRDPPETLPNARPPTAKNTGAAYIFEVLKEHNVDTWKACVVIADMLIGADIDHRPHDKVKRALYDKLRRIEVR